jgi:predicted nicotinamide N-methyase
MKNREPPRIGTDADYQAIEKAAGIETALTAVLREPASALRGHVSDTGFWGATISAARGAEGALYWAEATIGADWESAATDAAGYTARAAVAASDAAGSASAKQQVYDAAIEMLDGVLKIGKQASPFAAGDVCLAIHAFGRARSLGRAVA